MQGLRRRSVAPNRTDVLSLAVPTAEATRVVERTGGKSGRERVANGVLSREDAWAYHNRLIDRQHFGRRVKKFKPEPL